MSWLVTIHRQISHSGPHLLWQQLLIALLVVPSCCYGLMVCLRNWVYDRHLIEIYKSRLPVLSVGNLAIGGTGKTPTVDWLVKKFNQQGQRPAIVSRGYGGKYSAAVAIVSDGHDIRMTVEQCGDEPLLLARRNPDCPVVIARNRAEGVREVEKLFDADLVILDDGFQHRKIFRDLDLVLLDAFDPFGNGWTLPAGKLRELKGALKRADILMLTRATDQISNPVAKIPTFSSCHRLSSSVNSLNGQSRNLTQLKGLRVLAFAGISDPNGFFDALRECGFTLQKTVYLPDHVEFTATVIASLNHAAKHCDLLLTTEKDFVKLKADAFDLPCYSVGLELDISDGDQLMQMINEKLWRKP